MKPYVTRQLLVVLIVYLGHSLVGFGLGWTAPMIPKLQDPDLTPLPRPPTDGEVSWIGSVLYIGTIMGPYISGYLSNYRGRKPCLILGGILTAFAFLILTVSTNLAMLIAGRIFTGLGTGIIFVINLVYIGEIASTNIRGILLTGTGIFSTLGTLIVYTIGPFGPYYVTSVVGLSLSVTYVVFLIYIPETPMFYVMQNRNEDATRSLISLGRADEIKDFDFTKPVEGQKGQLKDLFTIKSNRKALFITFTLNILQQMSGIIVVIFYATTIFELASSSINPNIATIIIGVTQLVASCITPLLVDRNGRRVLLMISTAACSITLSLLGIYFLLDKLNPYLLNNFRWAPMVIIILFFLSYDLGFSIIPATLIGEFFQSNVRSIGSAITVTTAWLFGFGVATAFGYMISGIGAHFTFWIFATACACAFFFTIIVVPETKGRTFAEIEQLLS